MSTSTTEKQLPHPPSQPEEKETRASFTASPISIKPQTSPLLSSTPPTISKSLIKSYPYLLIINKFLSIVTWTDKDIWCSVLTLLTSSILTLYFETILTFFGHLIIILIIYLYAETNKSILSNQETNPTLDDIIFTLNETTTKIDLLISPVKRLALNSYDLKRLLFTTIFLSPVYILVSYFLLGPRCLILIASTFLLSYHSSWSIVTRRVLWRFKVVRLIFFYLTGLNFISGKNSILNKFTNLSNVEKFGDIQNLDGKPIRFTYVIYENQRRWLGIGWTSNLLSYERTPWTDEFLNESLSIHKFQLPQIENNGMIWKWVDKTWRLDLTNDGALVISNKKTKTTANPNFDDGFVYYDNTWKKPSTEDSYSKYTRRRRWIRTAELINVKNNNNNNDTSLPSPTSTISPSSPTHAITSDSSTQETDSEYKGELKKKKLRFDNSADKDKKEDESIKSDEDITTEHKKDI